MTALLLILIIVIQKGLCLDEIEACYKSLNANEIRKSFHCDEFLISSLQDILDSARKFNKYLEHKVETNMDYKNQTCEIPQENKTCIEPQHYSTCKDAIATNGGPGAYIIVPPYVNMKPLMVYCETDPEGGSPWLVIQRRICDNMNFDRDMESYVNGFGGLYDSYWMGLKRIHMLTTNHDFELWIELTTFNGKIFNAKYSHFGIGRKGQKYNLLFLGNYSGDAGDGLRASAGYAFSTNDEKNEESVHRHCKTTLDGGWWYGMGSCDRHLNGNFTRIAWRKKYSFLKVQMAIREKTLIPGCS